MKRYLALGLCFLALAAAAWALGDIETSAYRPFYWVGARVPDIVVNEETVSANGRQIYLYRSLEDLQAGRYIEATLVNNRVVLNGFDIGIVNFRVGQTYIFATEAIRVGGNTYGASGTITITGYGWDEVSSMAIVTPYDAPQPPGQVVEEAPKIKIWFGNRLYQSSLVTDDDPFIVFSQPKVKLDISIAEPYALAANINDYSIVVDQDTPDAESLDLRAQNMTQKVFAANLETQAEELKALVLEYELTSELSDGKHTLTFSAMSAGSLGTPSSGSATATVEVIGGPHRLLDTPISFPSPFSIEAHGVVTIQYKLSTDMAVQIIFVDISGQRVKNFIFEEGQEGGSAGINKVTWDGRTDRGTLAGNGIYLGTFIERNENRRLGSVKLTVVN
ncbi:MAG: hypothetical protein ABH823_05565 [bacterium]